MRYILKRIKGELYDPYSLLVVTRTFTNSADNWKDFLIFPFVCIIALLSSVFFLLASWLFLFVWFSFNIVNSTGKAISYFWKKRFWK